MLFRQLFEPQSSTYTYLVACGETGEAALIDPVLETAERDLAEIEALGLSLRFTIETHIHADHVTAASSLRDRTGCRCAVPAKSGAERADIAVSEGEPIRIGTLDLHPLYTPGHTDDHHCYFVEAGEGGRIFTGDALLIDGCGRTDFQNGDSAALYNSVREKIFSLPGDTLVYPAHDYNQRHVSSVGQERERNPRLGGERTVEQFIAIMAALDLPPPKKIGLAVPANRRCGQLG